MKSMVATLIAAAILSASTPAEAAALAAQDIVTVDQSAQPHTLYAWIHEEPTKLNIGANQYAMNAGPSRSPILAKGVPVAGGKLVRIDQRLLSPTNADYWDTFHLLEQLAQVDPYFHAGPIVTLPAPQKIWYAGAWFDKRQTRQFAHHTGLQNMLLVHSLTGRFMPIIRADWLNIVSLSTLDVGGAKGKYYEFRGIDKLDRDGWLKRHGSSEAVFQGLKAQDKIGLFISGVTSRSRRVDMFFGVGTRPSVGPTLISITRDTKEGSTDVNQHAIRNLIKFLEDAQEGIASLENGLQEYTLWDRVGKLLQAAVPDDIAHDSTKQSPRPVILEPGLSCISCHGPHDGWIPANNDVQELYRLTLPNGFRGDIFGEAGSVKLGNSGLILRDVVQAAELYGGDTTIPLRLARDVHARATFLLTDGLTVPEVSAELTRQRNEYLWYVSTEKAISEMGEAVQEGETAAEAFARIVPLLPVNEFGFSPEDPAILRLRQGKEITRADWEHVYADAMIRKAGNGLEAVQ